MKGSIDQFVLTTYHDMLLTEYQRPAHYSLLSIMCCCYSLPRELNEMVDSHQKQLISWETDRKRVGKFRPLKFFQEIYTLVTVLFVFS